MAKNYNKRREAHLVCLNCNDLWKKCNCPPVASTAWVICSDEELQFFFKTGLVPDYEAELWASEGSPAPSPIKLGEPSKKMEYLETLKRLDAEKEAKAEEARLAREAARKKK